MNQTIIKKKLLKIFFCVLHVLFKWEREREHLILEMMSALSQLGSRSQLPTAKLTILELVLFFKVLD